MTPLIFPCPVAGNFDRQLDLMLADWQPDLAVITVNLAADHLNHGDIVHGGVLATLVDVTGAYAGCYEPPDFTVRALTLTLSVSYTGQARSGQLVATARKQGGGKNTFFSAVEVRDSAGQLLAFGQATYRYRRPADAPAIPHNTALSDPSDLAPPDIGC